MHVGALVALGERNRGVLPAFNRSLQHGFMQVMNDARWPAPVECHVERVDEQFSAHVLRHRPADDAPVENVENDRKEQDACHRRHVGDLGDPELVGCSNSELATRSGAGRASLSRFVVANALRLAPWRLRSRIKRARRRSRR